jgi:hypothetical protein
MSFSTLLFSERMLIAQFPRCLLQDQLSANFGVCMAPSPLAVYSVVFSLLLVNAMYYVFLLQFVYWILLQVGFLLEHFRVKKHSSISRSVRKKKCLTHRSNPC